MRLSLFTPSTLILAGCLTLMSSSCVSTSSYGKANMGGKDIDPQERKLQISSEPTGNFYYGRRYFVDKTRFWGYLRQPRQPWSEATLVMMNESVKSQPDRMPEVGPYNARHGYDQNYQYRITGSYTGRKIYDPASNLFIREFKPSGFSLIERQPGWLFTPQDHYNERAITLINKSVKRL